MFVAYSAGLVILSGPIASGKTTLARNLAQLVPAVHVSTSGLISAAAGRELDRRELQRIGVGTDLLGAKWIIDAVRRASDRSAAASVVVVDAVRTAEQILELRKAAAGMWWILHVHLSGNDGELAARHQTVRRGGDAAWHEAMSSPTETASSVLEAQADVVIDVTSITSADVTARVMARVARLQRIGSNYADVLVGGQWGSEGKGNLAFFLAPEYDLLVRVGAPNAGHKIRGHDGVVYTHRQLPSGTRATDSPLLLGAGSVINVGILM